MRPGKIIPKTPHVIGQLPGRIGPYNISPTNARKVPLQIVHYGPRNVKAHLSWENVVDQAAGRSEQLPRLSDQMLRSLLLPKDDIPAALLVHKDQLAQKVLTTVRQMVRACRQKPDQAAPYMVLVPHLDEKGESKSCFALSQAGVDAKSLTESNLANLRGLSETQVNNILFVNIFS
jgi:hypothetical protein